jgi:hypothetical protein
MRILTDKGLEMIRIAYLINVPNRPGQNISTFTADVPEDGKIINVTFTHRVFSQEAAKALGGKQVWKGPNSDVKNIVWNQSPHIQAQSTLKRTPQPE